MEIDPLDFTIPLDITTESVWKYCPGGFCPIDIGQVVADRFKIIHKLGFGGFSTVWLARDQKKGRYVALKIVSADESKAYESVPKLDEFLRANPDQFVSELERLTLNSHNGSHLCQVFPVMGPNLFNMAVYNRRLFPDVARKFAWQAAMALATMHSSGLCHGDLTPNNFVLRLSKPLDDLSEDDIYDILGYPRMEPLQFRTLPHRLKRVYMDGRWETLYMPPKKPASRSKRRRMEKRKCSGPTDLVHPAELTLLPLEYLSESIAIIDFDQAYFSETPPRHTGIPPGYMAPEAIFERQYGPRSDIWALGCTFFRIRAVMNLISDFDSSPLNTAYEVYRIFGPIPDRWRKVPFDDDGWPVYEKHDGNIPSMFKGEVHISTPHSLRELLDERVHDAAEPAHDGSLWWELPMKQVFPNSPILDYYLPNDAVPMSTEELDSFHDLLLRIFTYEPEMRATLKEILNHPWIQGRPLS